jgi:hypothetical protein
MQGYRALAALASPLFFARVAGGGHRTKAQCQSKSFGDIEVAFPALISQQRYTQLEISWWQVREPEFAFWALSGITSKPDSVILPRFEKRIRRACW